MTDTKYIFKRQIQNKLAFNESQFMFNEETSRFHMKNQIPCETDCDKQDQYSKSQFSNSLFDHVEFKEEYIAVFQCIKKLAQKVKELLVTQRNTEIKQMDLVSKLVHKELIESMFIELKEIKTDLYESNFVKTLLNKRQWKSSYIKKDFLSFLTPTNNKSTPYKQTKTDTVNLNTEDFDLNFYSYTKQQTKECMDIRPGTPTKPNKLNAFNLDIKKSKLRNHSSEKKKTLLKEMVWL